MIDSFKLPDIRKHPNMIGLNATERLIHLIQKYGNEMHLVRRKGDGDIVCVQFSGATEGILYDCDYSVHSSEARIAYRLSGDHPKMSISYIMRFDEHIMPLIYKIYLHANDELHTVKTEEDMFAYTLTYGIDPTKLLTKERIKVIMLELTMHLTARDMLCGVEDDLECE